MALNKTEYELKEVWHVLVRIRNRIESNNNEKISISHANKELSALDYVIAEIDKSIIETFGEVV